MGHLIKISSQADWFAANWASEHAVRLIQKFLSPGAPEELKHSLSRMEEEQQDLDWSLLPKHQIEEIHTAAERALVALRRSGAPSELFASRDGFAGFMELFYKLVEEIKRDQRINKAAEPGATDNPDDAQRLREDY